MQEKPLQVHAVTQKSSPPQEHVEISFHSGVNFSSASNNPGFVRRIQWVATLTLGQRAMKLLVMSASQPPNAHDLVMASQRTGNKAMSWILHMQLTYTNLIFSKPHLPKKRQRSHEMWGVWRRIQMLRKVTHCAKCILSNTPGFIHSTGVTGRRGSLFHTQNADRWMPYPYMHEDSCMKRRYF